MNYFERLLEEPVTAPVHNLLSLAGNAVPAGKNNVEVNISELILVFHKMLDI